jgi:hypothetical protein
MLFEKLNHMLGKSGGEVSDCDLDCFLLALRNTIFLQFSAIEVKEVRHHHESFHQLLSGIPKQTIDVSNPINFHDLEDPHQTRNSPSSQTTPSQSFLIDLPPHILVERSWRFGPV